MQLSVGGKRMRRLRVFRLVLLVVVNGLLFGLVEWSLPLWLPLIRTSSFPNAWMQLLSNLCEGLLVAQFLFIGFWCALAPERLVVRLLAGVLFAGLLMGIHFRFFWTNSVWQSVAADEAGKYCGLALIAFLLLRALRPWCGWRLAWDAAPRQHESRQFRILDLLAWTTAVAVPLGLLQTLYGAAAPRLAILTALTFAAALPVTIPICYWATHPARNYHWLIGLLLWGLLWSACIVMLVNGFMYLRAGRAGLPFWKESLLLFAIWSAYYLPLILVFTGNVLVLGKIGLRPSSKSLPACA